jgi:hypothetical protein
MLCLNFTIDSTPNERFIQDEHGLARASNKKRKRNFFFHHAICGPDKILALQTI